MLTEEGKDKIAKIIAYTIIYGGTVLGFFLLLFLETIVELILR